MVVFVDSDLMCGALFCNLPAIANQLNVNFVLGQFGLWTISFKGIRYSCIYAYYMIFVKVRAGPAFVPNGAACGNGKVELFDNLTYVFWPQSYSVFARRAGVLH